MSKLWSIMALAVIVFGVLTFVVADQTWLWTKPMNLPADYSEHGHTIDSLYYFILVLTGIVFIATEGVLFYFMWKYDAKTTKEPVKFSHGSHTLEIVWTIIPAATLLFIAIFQFNSWSEVKIRKPDIAPTVEVTARQWEWRIRYPGEDGKLGTSDDIFDVNELLIPANDEVLISLKSADVLHSFFVPNLRIKQDAVPGMKIPVWFKVPRENASKPLSFEIVCAEHCGARHYAMKGKITVLSPEDYRLALREKYLAQNSTVDPQAVQAAGGAQ